MRVHLIRHGKTEANEKRLYCGFTDLPLSASGKQELASLKQTSVYPSADIYLTSGLKRTGETLCLLYNREADYIFNEFREMHFGAFEMKSYEELKDKPEYQEWISGDNSVACPCGESRSVFESRVKDGLKKLSVMQVDSAVVICHGGVIVTIMEMFFPGKKNFYEWQPGYGKGYTIDIVNENAVFISEI